MAVYIAIAHVLQCVYSARVSWTRETERYLRRPVYTNTCWAPMRTLLLKGNESMPGCMYSVNGSYTGECDWRLEPCVVDTKRLSRLDRAYCIQSVIVTQDGDLSNWTAYLEGAHCFRSQFRLALDGQCGSDQCVVVIDQAGKGGRRPCCCTKPGCNRNIVFKFTLASKVSFTNRSTIRRWLICSMLLLVSGLFSLLALMNRRLRTTLLCQQKRNGRTTLYAPCAKDDEARPLNSPPSAGHRLTAKQLSFKELRDRGKFGRIYRAVLKADIYQEFAVKVFPMSEQASFENERHIFQVIAGDTGYAQFVLRYFAADSCSLIKGMVENCIITQYCVYGSLYDFLTLKKFVSLSQMLKIVVSVTEGLSYLHEERARKPSIAHRDFKSRNVILTDDLSARVADFGLARVVGDTLGDLHSPVGTARYMAPEVLEGAISFKSSAFLQIDVYAFALVLYEVCACCKDLIDSSELREYHLPFDYLGVNPCPSDMKLVVLAKQGRPELPPSFTSTELGTTLFQTMRDCWDQDPDSRLSMACAKMRLRHCATPTTATIEQSP